MPPAEPPLRDVLAQVSVAVLVLCLPAPSQLVFNIFYNQVRAASPTRRTVSPKNEPLWTRRRLAGRTPAWLLHVYIRPPQPAARGRRAPAETPSAVPRLSNSTSAKRVPLCTWSSRAPKGVPQGEIRSAGRWGSGVRLFWPKAAEHSARPGSLVTEPPPAHVWAARDERRSWTWGDGR